jgi:cysteine sulfinate desulfinase/cysteine desulfurase-like protein
VSQIEHDSVLETAKQLLENEFDVEYIPVDEYGRVSVEDVTAEVEQERVNQEALAYLASTDWLIVRQAETGAPCPEEVLAERARARASVVKGGS